jgi:hypothetical protein
MAVPSTAAPIPSKNPSVVFRSAWAGAVDRQMNMTTAVVIEISVFIFILLLHVKGPSLFL